MFLEGFSVGRQRQGGDRIRLEGHGELNKGHLVSSEMARPGVALEVSTRNQVN